VSTGTQCWESAAVTDVGQVRQLNEDSYLNRPDLGLWAVADGMGGHTAGEVASARLCSALSGLAPDCTLGAAVDFIDAQVQAVNEELMILARSKPAGGVIGCTLVALVARGSNAVFAWAGDSRLYRLRDGRLVQLTDDHSLVQEAIDLASDTTSINSNIITRAVGADASLVLELEGISLNDGDRFLLCSDGLNRDLDDAGILNLLQAGTAAEVSRTLVAGALRVGGADNITVLVADFGGVDDNHVFPVAG
jgi:serine/threonine protein phosphatase PrpC